MGISSSRMANLAIERGVKRTDITGGLRRYLDDLYYEKSLYPDIYVYNNSVFLFVNDVLVTVLSLPTKYHGTMVNIKRKREVVLCEQ